MSCSVGVGKNLGIASLVLTTVATTLTTANNLFSNGKFALGDLIADKGGDGKLVQFALFQELTAGGSLTTTGFRVHVWRNDTALTATADDVFAITPALATDIIDTFEINASDWVELDTLNAMAVVNPDIEVWAETGKKELNFTIQALATFTLASNTVTARAVTEQN